MRSTAGLVMKKGRKEEEKKNFRAKNKMFRKLNLFGNVTRYATIKVTFESVVHDRKNVIYIIL